MASEVIRLTETMAKTTFGFLTDETLPLFTDLYELRMMQAYYNQDHNPRATFSLFVRDLPPDRGSSSLPGWSRRFTTWRTYRLGIDPSNS